jgi:SAM-dependent methyltransferase
MIKDSLYWSSFYKENDDEIIFQHSLFSEFTLEYIKRYHQEDFDKLSLLDIGCGTGKDTIYFRKEGIDSYGVDAYIESKLPFIEKKKIENVEKKYNFYYMRFFLHTIKEEQCDLILDSIHKVMDTNSLLFIETRSTKEISDKDKSITNFKGAIGEEHFRMLYSLDFLKEKLKNKFEFLYEDESKGLAPCKNEDPFIIRIILIKKQKLKKIKQTIKELFPWINGLRHVGKPKVNTKHNLESLKEICEHLKEIEYIIFYGTLLGFHRERNIIQNDDDVDFLVKKDFRDEIIAILIKLNYKIHYTNQNFVNGIKILESGNVERIVDFYFYEDLDGNFLLEKWNFIGHPHDPSTHLHIPKNIIYPIRTAEIQGILCNVPHNIEKCCRFLYGDRFMTPLKKKDYTFEIIDNKPNIIYNR